MMKSMIVLAFTLLISLANAFGAPAYAAAPAKADVFDQSFVEFEKDTDDANAVRILLIAGYATPSKKAGGHEFLAGCVVLADMLRQTPGVHPIIVRDWPKNEKLFDRAAAVVFYMDGGGKQTTLASKARIAKMDELSARGVGIVHLHATIDYPGSTAEHAIRWMGGAWTASHSKKGRGHWDTVHDTFPKHPITRGVTPWKLNDGWLTTMKFVDDMKGITPLVWSAKATSGDPKGGNKAVAAWAYERPIGVVEGGNAKPRAAGARAFVFTGIDAHFAWALDGMRQFTVNGVLWSAGVAIPDGGAKCVLDRSKLDRAFDKRGAKKATK